MEHTLQNATLFVHSEVSSNAESTKQHREEEGRTTHRVTTALTRRGEASWIDSLVVPSLSAVRAHSRQRSSRPLQPEKHQKLPARLRQRSDSPQSANIAPHSRSRCDDQGRKEERKDIQMRSAESPTESPCAKPVDCATCSFHNTNSRYDGIPSSHIIRGLPRKRRALPFARLLMRA